MGLLDGKIALVTGGGSGIGRATALRFAGEGSAGVVVVDIDPVGGEETVQLIKEIGSAASFCQADVADEAAVTRMLRLTVDQFGRLDCAFNNAGMNGEHVSFVDTPVAEIHRVVNLNLIGVLLCIKHEIRQMRAQGGGSIVNTSSIAGFIGTASAGSYTASKHGVLGVTKAAALDLAGEGIRVNAVCPGRIDTPMLRASAAVRSTIGALDAEGDPIEVLQSAVPLGRLGRPDEIAEAVVWLCSDRASYVTGESITVDGGLCVTRSR